MKKSDDTIEVKKRSGDRAIFESNFLQQVSDGIDYLKDESKEVLKELDKANLNEIDLEEVGEITFNHISDVADELSQLKSELIDSDELPQPIKESSKNIKAALNRDNDYVRRAQRRFDRINSNEFVNTIKANARVIELCEKAIKINPSNAEAYYLKGRALVNLDKYSEAIEEYINSLAIEDDIKVWIAIGNANTLNEDYADAIDVYDSVLQKDEDSFDAIKGKAIAFYSCGDYKKADEEFKKASEIDSLDESSKELWYECLEYI